MFNVLKLIVLKLTYIAKSPKTANCWYHLLLFVIIHTVLKQTKVTCRINFKRKEMIIMALYSYLRVSTKHQKIERQLTNVIGAYPELKDHPERIFKDKYTGTTIDRPDWNRLYKIVVSHSGSSDYKEGDRIVFDELSRMARNAEEGFALYKELFLKGIDLEFLKEHHIDTDSYRKAMQGIINIKVDTGDKSADKMINTITEAVNEFILNKVEQDIYRAFEQAEHEVDLLHKRIHEGMIEAKANGKRIGIPKGTKLKTKKGKKVRETILKHNKAFGGTLTDKETWTLAGVCKTTYYKYKKELEKELLTKEKEFL